ncbi:MAG: hypothetical protein ACI4Q3_05335, partial [Kiritimatiellia bacterium]
AAAMAAAADIQSANVVGYSNTAARENLNWYSPVFRSIGCNTTDINEVNLDDGGAGEVGWGDSMQIVGPLGNPSEAYLYYDKSMNPAGEEAGNFWGDAELNPVNVVFDGGDGIAIDNANGLEFNIVSAGEAPKGNVSFAARENLNWSGNPFPAAININDVNLDDGGAGEVGWGDSMQIVGPLGNPSEAYLYYDKSMNPAGEEAGNFWGDAELNPVDVTLEPGAGFAIDNANGLTFNIVITCPYTL